jgi:hypothetical protein
MSTPFIESDSHHQTMDVEIHSFWTDFDEFGHALSFSDVVVNVVQAPPA